MNYLEMTMTIQKLSQPYTEPDAIKLAHYFIVEGKVLGRCVFYTEGDLRYVTISIAGKVARTEVLIKGVLWHEICHAIPWINNGKTDGHSSAFYRRLWSRPRYALLSLLAEFWFGLLDAFN